MTLQRKTPLRRTSGLSSSGKLRARSKKMEATYRRRRELVADMLDNSAGDNWCQVILLIQQVDPAHRCGLYVADVHELLLQRQSARLDDVARQLAQAVNADTASSAPGPEAEPDHPRPEKQGNPKKLPRGIYRLKNPQPGGPLPELLPPKRASGAA